MLGNRKSSRKPGLLDAPDWEENIRIAVQIQISQNWVGGHCSQRHTHVTPGEVEYLCLREEK